jgi:site-specific DNA-methyltransferase (adenine-specific)
VAVTWTGTREEPLSSLQPFPGNARRGDVTAIRASIRRFGQYRAVVVRDAGDGGLVVLAGNHTVAALAAEGHSAARCEVIVCSDDEARRINLADNRLAELGTYDDGDLAVLLQGLDGDFAGTGWGQCDLDALLGGGGPGGRGDPDEVPEPPPVPVTRPGDLWQLGPHLLLCGDGTSAADVARVTGALPGVGMVYTDPPYGISIVRGDGKLGKGHGYRPVAGDDSTDAARDAFRLLSAAYPAARHVWWGGNHYAGAAALPDASCWLVWDKENGDRTFADCELAWTSHPGAVRMFRHMWHGARASEQGRRLHPNQKPVALHEWAFGVIDPQGQRSQVLDVFGGSGSTLIAAQRTGRTAALVELDPAYCDVICARFEAYAGTTRVLASTRG